MSTLLIASTIVCFSEYFAPVIIKYLTGIIYSENKMDQRLREDIRQLHKEMLGISPVNEFAKFTRLQRRHTKMMDELKENASKRSLSRSTTQLFLTYGNKFVSMIISLLLMYMYGKEPVVVLPNSLLWPFGSLFSWPSPYDNAISLTAWMILTRMVVDACKNGYS